MKKSFFVSLLWVVSVTVSAQTYYYGNTPIERVVSQKSESRSSSEMTITPDTRPAWARSFPMGGSKLPERSASSSWSIDTGSYRASSYKTDTTSSYPTYDPNTGAPEIVTYKNTSSSYNREKREQVMLDYYGRPIVPAKKVERSLPSATTVVVEKPLTTNRVAAASPREIIITVRPAKATRSANVPPALPELPRIK